MYRRAYFGAVGRDCRSICRRTFDISGFPVRKLIYRREETSGRIGIGCSACVARTGTHEFRIRTFDTSEICRLSARYASGANTGHFAPAGTRDDFSSVSSFRRFADGGTVRNISDEFGRNVRRKAVSYRSGADSRSCGRTAIRILHYRKSGRGKSSYESVPTHGITCERRGPSRGGHPFP